MSKINRELGSIVREYRLKAEMTQLELAKKLGYDSMQFVSLIERGHSKIPYKVIGKLIILLGIPEKKITRSLVNVFLQDLNSEIEQGKKSVS